MSIDEKESRRPIGVEPLAQKRGEVRTMPLDELKRQLGLNLIDAARDQSESDTYVSCFRGRR